MRQIERDHPLSREGCSQKNLFTYGAARFQLMARSKIEQTNINYLSRSNLSQCQPVYVRPQIFTEAVYSKGVSPRKYKNLNARENHFWGCTCHLLDWSA